MSMKILIVDDEEGIFETLSSLLLDEGFQVSWAKDASAFRKKALEEKPDLIILDIMLGGNISGPDVYDALLHEGLSPHVPVIFLSGLVTESELEDAHPGRTYAMHKKPFNYPHLLRDIRCLTNAA